MNIRRAVYADCEELAALDAVCNPSAWTQRQFESALVSPSEQVFLATALEYRRRGVASALLEYWFAHLPEGTQRLLLEVRAGNIGAQALYVAHGFTDAGRRKNYYRTADGKTEDAVLMEKIC